MALVNGLGQCPWERKVHLDRFRIDIYSRVVVLQVSLLVSLLVTVSKGCRSFWLIGLRVVEEMTMRFKL